MTAARKPATVTDGLANIATGLGTTADKNSYRGYVFNPLDQYQAEAAYRTSWLPRKIVDVPPGDMTKAWRDWQAEAPQIEALEAAEARVQLRRKTRRALVLARLYGGGALVLGVQQGAPRDPVNLATLRRGSLAYVHVVSRHQLSFSALDMNPESPWFGEPTMWTLGGVDIHPSRVVPFLGQPTPEGSAITGNAFWGDPVMQSIGDAVMNADLAQSGFATLINEASLDIINIPSLMQSLSSSEYEALLLRRLSLAQLAKSTHRALILDGGETWAQRQVNWAGMPDIISSYLNVVAGASDIPVTRLLGQSPKGLQSTGNGEERDYLMMISAQQEDALRPALERVDEILIPSALGSRPAEVHFTFAPLIMASEKEAADTEKVVAETAAIMVNGGIASADVMAKVMENRMIESGQWPGVEAALDDYRDDMNTPDDDGEDDPSALTEGEAVPRSPAADALFRVLAKDAAPRSLYVCRPVVNVAELAAWAKAQGLPALQPDLHVTIVYSRQPVDWMKIEGEWNADDKGQVTIPPGGVRIVEPLGDRTAVLLFTSAALSWRHQSIVNSGASHDYPDYQPHISLTGETVDLSGVEPYRGKIVLGPEVFQEIRAKAE